MERKILSGISSTTWEHPADRAALNTLRAIPGFDQVVRKIAGFFGEKGVRQLFLANAVRVGPRQRPRLWALYGEVRETLDWPEVPELYVTQTPLANAAAVGFERPFIVLNSGMLALLDREEQRDVLGHELGHIMSGHTTYTTIAIVVMTVGVQALPFLAGVAILPFQLALMEWYRKAELSADRAGLLATQDPQVSWRTFLKLAGGPAGDDEISVEAFLEQASAYEREGDVADKVWQVLNTAFRSHPFGTVRAAELARWLDSGEYDRILRGEYRRRGEEGGAPLEDDVSAAAQYYKDQAKSALDTIASVIERARAAFAEATRSSGNQSGGDSEK
ncbi:MAG TPA: M48 family metallopeptidase [Gemmatimonadaceae bacterium]|nr:M48 family metallopeptidase [Gemmatimonadaceae bacterium]